MNAPVNTAHNDVATAAGQAVNAAAGVAAHDTAVILGSGWAPAADRIGTPNIEIPLTDLPGFAPPTAGGHVGKVRSVTVGDRAILVFLGRTHLYEGHGVGPVVHGVRV